ncbi:MAG TPA: 2-amino-4-hydroxy-6-hydroxymethyldihydropteridine diphosphokinase [Cyclobacteriaceae bacterium]|nr:2-amino-4-hydroxy-6-hydroxymethyldihydropteridine diphosphokinase [Cyclobacteriaceae bacterium]
MHQAVLLIGGNLGDREQLIRQAQGLLSKIGRIKAASSLYETQAWGNASEGEYLNQALILETKHSPTDLLQRTQEIENFLGRTRTVRWGSRTMDIDIIYFDDLVYQDEILILPHPLMSERKFVLMPLAEILPDFIHPVFKVSNKELFLRCKDMSEVTVKNKA